MTDHPGGGLTPRIILGLGAIAAGVLLTLRNAGVPWARELLLLWPLVLAVLGLNMMLRPHGTSGRAFGLLLGLAGIWITLENFDLVRLEIWDLWPLLLVFAGGYLVWRSGPPGRRPAASGEDGGDYLQAFALLSGVTRRSGSAAFRGADLTAIMGGCEIDLTQASIREGRAIIDTFTWWGGLKIRLPPDWTVVTRVITLLGGLEDRTAGSAKDEKKCVVVRGLTIMGGIEIRN